jgi:hypothetical protein
MIFIFLCMFNTLHALTYTESSTGLIPPEMDGGNTELEFADINDDGYVDIMSIGDHGSPNVGTSQHGIMVWFGDGTGTWSVYQNGNFGYGGIAIGDVNNDGIKDVGFAMHHNYSSTDFGDQLMEVALGDGTGMNWTPWDDGLATNGETWGMFGTDFADIDNDGGLDIGSNSFGCSSGVHVYLNQNNGTWVQSFGFIGGNSTMDFCFGDVNKDGNADFAVNHEYGTVYFGDGTGNFVLADGNLPGSGSMGRYGTSLGDVDNDGGKDLAYVNYNGGVEVWIWDESDELWVDFSGTLPTSGSYQKTQLYDMNADGYVDVCAFGNGTFTLWLGNGAGTWTQDAQFTTPPPGYCHAFRVGGDIDHNGFPDIAMVVEEGSWPSYQNHLRCFKENSQAGALSITPNFPFGNETFKENSVQFIRWISEVPSGVQSFVTLEYSTAGAGGPWTLIAEDVPNNGCYQWQIPQVNSSNCYIKYTAWTFTDLVTAITPFAFTIQDGSVNIDNPEDNQHEFSLQNYPNPFTSSTEISYNPGAYHFEQAKVAVYNIKGQMVQELTFDNGSHSIQWDGRDRAGNQLANGVYLYKLLTENFESGVKRLLLIR